MIKANYKIIPATIGFLFVGIVLALLLEDCYRQFVRFLFKFFNGDKIQFVGKPFHLFASDSFILAFALFISLAFIVLYRTSRSVRIKKACLAILLFFVTTIMITALDSSRLILECTACDDGIRKLRYNELAYDMYFIISLAVSFLYLLA